MIDTRYATLDQTPEVLDIVGVCSPTNIDLGTVHNPLMVIAKPCYVVVAQKFIGVKNCIRGYIPPNERDKGGTLDIRDDRSHDLPLPLNYAYDGSFAFCSPSTLPTPDPADVGFVSLNFTREDRRVFVKESSDLIEHTPSCLVGNACFPLKFLGGMSRPSGSHPEHCLKPSRERSSGLVEDGVGSRVDLMPAVIALVARSFSKLVVLCNLVANRAVDAVWVAVALKPLKAGIIIRELPLKVLGGVFRRLVFGSSFHFIPPIHVLYHNKYVVSRDSCLILYHNLGSSELANTHLLSLATMIQYVNHSESQGIV